VATAAAVIAFAIWPHDTQTIEIAVRAVHLDPPAAAPITIGDRVAIVVEPGTAFRVIRAAADETRILVERRAVTARLFHPTAGHRLALEGGGVVASATGTVYSLAVGAGGATVRVDDGAVDVRDGAGARRVAAGTSWSSPGAATVTAPAAAAHALLALDAPPA